MFVGEAPSRSTARHGGHPLVGETGRRLAEWSGMSMAEFHRRTVCVNVFRTLPDRWSAPRATELATALWHRPDVQAAPAVVLLGARVAKAFGFGRAEPFVLYQTGGPGVAVLPHPSGQNLYWNDQANRDRASAFLRGLFGVTVSEPTQCSLLEV